MDIAALVHEALVACGAWLERARGTAEEEPSGSGCCGLERNCLVGDHQDRWCRCSLLETPSEHRAKGFEGAF